MVNLVKSLPILAESEYARSNIDPSRMSSITILFRPDRVNNKVNETASGEQNWRNWEGWVGDLSPFVFNSFIHLYNKHLLHAQIVPDIHK